MVPPAASLLVPCRRGRLRNLLVPGRGAWAPLLDLWRAAVQLARTDSNSQRKNPSSSERFKALPGVLCAKQPETGAQGPHLRSACSMAYGTATTAGTSETAHELVTSCTGPR